MGLYKCIKTEYLATDKENSGANQTHMINNSKSSLDTLLYLFDKYNHIYLLLAMGGGGYWKWNLYNCYIDQTLLLIIRRKLSKGIEPNRIFFIFNVIYTPPCNNQLMGQFEDK